MKLRTANLFLGFFVIVLFVLSVAAWLGGAVARVSAYDGCEPYPITAYSPTGIVGCVVYGEGIASWYHGTGIARNDCVWPWTSCTPIKITSLETGRSVIVTPTMFCDCYTGTNVSSTSTWRQSDSSHWIRIRGCSRSG
jgi:hypothetical protein